MIKSLWVKFLILLLSVSVIALSAAFIVRELLVADFRGYREGEIEDRVYWITAALESSFEKAPGWNRQRLIEDTIWSLMLGFEIKVYDTEGELVIDTESAIETLPPLTRKRITAISEQRYAPEESKFLPYVLFLGGTEIGRLELRFLHPQRETTFIQRSNMLLFFSLFTLGGIAVVLSIVFSRKLTNPIKQLTGAVAAVEKGNLKSRVEMSGSDEISRLSEAFNRMAKTLDVQESLRKKMTSNIAHELRTPLTVIRGELEGMMDGLIPIDGEHIQSLHAEIGRMRKIIEGLEELSQAEASYLTLRKESIELKPFLQNIIMRFMKMAHDRGVQMHLECEDGLRAHADPDRLSQIMINLINNSLKATGRNGQIRLRAAGDETAATISVIDDGAGIKQEDLPFIFERFYRTSSDGLGLGLTIVRELVEAHGGTVMVSSKYGKGSVFTVSLPDKGLHNSS
ncbi:MAG: sensor histidine kinase [bacterium]